MSSVQQCCILPEQTNLSKTPFFSVSHEKEPRNVLSFLSHWLIAWLSMTGEHLASAGLLMTLGLSLLVLIHEAE